MTNKPKHSDDIADELAAWLPTGTISRATPTEWTHPGDPNFADRVRERTDQLRNEQHLVGSLGELRSAPSMTQTQFEAK